MTASNANLDPLRPTRCMRCGYALDGLADTGICPECGLEYDQSTIVLYGEARGNTSTPATGSRGGILRYGAAMVFFLLMGWEDFHHGRGLWGLAIGAVFVGTFGIMMIWRIAARSNAPGGSLTQCRFNAYGAVQCDIPDETIGTTFPRWWGFMSFIGVWLLLFLVEREWIPLFITGAVLILIFVGFRQRLRHANTVIRSNSDARRLMISASNGWREAVAIPWAAIESVSVAPIRAKPHRRRVKVFRRKRWKDVPIDVEVECTADQEAALQLRCSVWQRATHQTRMAKLGAEYERGYTA